jgi:hypothetical protein
MLVHDRFDSVQSLFAGRAQVAIAIEIKLFSIGACILDIGVIKVAASQNGKQKYAADR